MIPSLIPLKVKCNRMFKTLKLLFKIFFKMLYFSYSSYLIKIFNKHYRKKLKDFY